MNKHKETFFLIVDFNKKNFASRGYFTFLFFVKFDRYISLSYMLRCELIFLRSSSRNCERDRRAVRTAKEETSIARHRRDVEKKRDEQREGDKKENEEVAAILMKRASSPREVINPPKSDDF